MNLRLVGSFSTRAVVKTNGRGELRLRMDGSVHEACVSRFGLSPLDIIVLLYLRKCFMNLECTRNARRKPEVVGSIDGFWLSGAILLGMALVVCIARPFARSQVNALQTSCSGRARCEAAKGHWVRFTLQGRVEKRTRSVAAPGVF